VREIMAEANMRVMRARAEVKAEYEAKIKEVKSKQWVRDKSAKIEAKFIYQFTLVSL
jgi:hypothetical protein